VAAALESYVTESIALLSVVAVLAVLISLAARRAGLGRALGPVELLARLPLEPRRSVLVVRVADRVLIIGSSEAGLVKLGELRGEALGELDAMGGDPPLGGWLGKLWRGGRRRASEAEARGSGPVSPSPAAPAASAASAPHSGEER
jgi:flagellar biosynthesis protein FliO